MLLYSTLSRIVYRALFGILAVSLCLYILPPDMQSIMPNFVSGRIVYSFFCLRAVSLCSFIQPSGG